MHYPKKQKNAIVLDIWGVRGAPEASRSIPERSLRSEDANIEKFWWISGGLTGPVLASEKTVKVQNRKNMFFS